MGFALALVSLAMEFPLSPRQHVSAMGKPVSQGAPCLNATNIAQNHVRTKRETSQV
jgi:hypothetical protein